MAVIPQKTVEPGSAKPRRTRLLGLGLASMLLLVAGCRQDMQDQPKFVPQRGTTFFADRRSVRPQVEHTVARGQLEADDYFSTGLLDGKESDLSPFPVTMQVLERGQERLQHLLHAVPLAGRKWRRDDRPCAATSRRGTSMTRSVSPSR